MVFSTIAVGCFGGSDGAITVEGSGGVGPLTFDIGAGPDTSGTFTGLAAGSYIIVIEDSLGCVVDFPIEIVEPDSLELIVDAVVNVSCAGGTDGEITVSALGGVPDYEFGIDGGAVSPTATFTDLSAGFYDMEVIDLSGCSTIFTVEVTEPPALVLDLVSSSDVTCFGGSDGSISIMGSGGTGALEYSIDGGAFSVATSFAGISAGTHTIVVRDENGCEATLDVIINEAPEIEVVDIVVSEGCLGDCNGSIELTAWAGVAPYLYSIDDCVTTDPTGIYADLCAGDYSI